MKGRDSRRQTIITAAAAAIGATITGVIVGVGAALPFILTKGADAAEKISSDARRKHYEGMPAAQAKKAELDELKKEKKQLEKDKKALEKKKLNARKNQAKKIYKERVANGYEASVPVLESEADKAFENSADYVYEEPKKKKKKSKKETPVVIEKQEKLRLAVTPQNAAGTQYDDVGEEDYSSSASMFKGISFNP